ncbi:DNA-binding protein RFX5 isoform X2 [Ambystoma mexicanum]|uniref:DNA-binding protein RFX5 isoform X2 n=1 Tax=Ambystoma mexicanum TaxID=8296 RepID=UPI0037E80C21
MFQRTDVMADDDPYLSLSQRGSVDDVAESDSLLQTLKPKIHKCVQSKVDSILQEVQKFSDNDKLYLYLQLPPGPSAAEKSLDVNSLSTAEHMRACNWIRNHLEEHTDTCLPKQDVYDTYKRYCDKLCCRPLSAANFGKIIREIFPNIKARRLGGRGQSKYCYSGIRRRTVVKMPSLPSLDLKTTDVLELTDVVQSYSIDVIEASCALICNWAEKILKRSFNNVVEVAQFLIHQHIISPRCPSAEIIMSMVVSDVIEKAQRSQKPRNDRVEGSDITLEPAKRDDKTLKTSTNQQPAEKKATAEGEKSASSPQVDALVARLPPLRPRMTSAEQTIGCCTLVQTPATVFGSNLTAPPLRNSVQISPLPTSILPLNVPTGPNGSGLISLQKAVPVINVILPTMPTGVAEIQIHPTGTTGEMVGIGQSGGTLPSQTLDNQKSTATKRPLEQPIAAEEVHDAACKKRRGRPRKLPGDSAADTLPSPLDSEKSTVVLLEGLEGSSIVRREERPMDETAKATELKGSCSVLKMDIPRMSLTCDATPSHAARVEASLQMEAPSITNTLCIKEAVKIDSGPLPNIYDNCKETPPGPNPSVARPSTHSPPSEETTKSSSLPGLSKCSMECRGSTAEINLTHRVSDAISRDMSTTAPRVIHTKEELASTSQVSVIQDGRHSMQKYILGFSQEKESGNVQRPMIQKATEIIPSKDSETLATDGVSKTTSTPQESSKAAMSAKTPSSTSVLTWGVPPSKARGDRQTVLYGHRLASDDPSGQNT